MNFGLRNCHTDNFSVAHLSVVGDALEIMIADAAFFVCRSTSSISSRSSQLMIVSAENAAFSRNEFMLNVPKALNAIVKLWRQHGFIDTQIAIQMTTYTNTKVKWSKNILLSRS